MIDRLRRAPTFALAGAFALLVAGAGFLVWRAWDQTDQPAAPPASFSNVFAGLCESRAAALAGAPDIAQGVFLRRSHVGLHTLASALTDDDYRALAADLLEAKAAVEVSLPAGGPDLAADLTRLLDAAAAGLDTLQPDTDHRCPEDER